MICTNTVDLGFSRPLSTLWEMDWVGGEGQQGRDLTGGETFRRRWEGCGPQGPQQASSLELRSEAREEGQMEVGVPTWPPQVPFIGVEKPVAWRSGQGAGEDRGKGQLQGASSRDVAQDSAVLPTPHLSTTHREWGDPPRSSKVKRPAVATQTSQRRARRQGPVHVGSAHLHVFTHLRGPSSSLPNLSFASSQEYRDPTLMLLDPA